MPARTQHHYISGSRDGVALIMVLAFIVLLTILIVSLISFTRSNRVATASYSKSIQAQEIAQGGIQDILGDLHKEIVAGSYTNTVTYATNGGPMIYVPTTNFTASPARIGYNVNTWGSDVNLPTTDDLSPTLVRVSRVSQDSTHPLYFYPHVFTNTGYYDPSLATNLINRASAASTATPSANGRFISAARWNKTFLLAPTTGTNTAATDPIAGAYAIPQAFAVPYVTLGGAALPNGQTAPFGPPDWVYVSRTGSRVCNVSTDTMAKLLPSNNLTASYGTITPGSNPPASPVVGRYAYIVYDESALLDMNVAGYTSASQTGNLVSSPADSTTGITQAVNGKSFLSYADLTAVGIPQATVDSFVAWRNASATSTGNSYLTNVISTYAKNGFLSLQSGDSPLVGRQDLINYLAKNDTNFNNAAAESTAFQAGTKGPALALPYLGTFTRDVNKPSYSPPFDATNLGAANNGTGNVYAYHANAESATNNGIANPNRDLANIRWPSAFSSVNHYSDAGTAPPPTYTVNAGDPFLQSRFSLGKINLLSQANPATGASPTATAAIQSCFGLKWDYPGGSSTTTANGGNKCWNYVGASSEGYTTSSPASSIDTLDVVAAEGREPNFFELLKAAILSGSLGKEPGPAGWTNGTDTSVSYNPDGSGSALSGEKGPAGLYCHTFGPSSTTLVPARIADIQIIQIGANIIDQYDADSYPTAIYFRYLTGATDSAFDPVLGPSSNPTADYPLYGPVDMVYGDENIPCLDRIMQNWCTTGGNGTSGNPADNSYNNANSMAVFFGPELWNPHQKPASAVANALTNFQIRAYGTAQSFWGQLNSGADETSHGGYNTGKSYVTSFFQGSSSAGGNTESCSNGTLNFILTSPSTIFPFYDHPYLLTKDQISGVTATSPASQNIAVGSPNPYPYYDDATYTSHFVAFCTGMTPPLQSPALAAPYQPFYVDTTATGKTRIVPASAACNTFVLGWLDGATIGTGNFHPYSFITGMFTVNYNNIRNNDPYDRAGNVTPDKESPYVWATIDPRTSRFSLYASLFGGAVAHNTTLFTSSGAHKSASAYMPYLAASGFNPSYLATANNAGGFPEDWEVNSANSSVNSAGSTPPYTYYTDPDGVVRPGDSYYGNAAVGDGMMLFNTAGTGGSASGDLASNGDLTGNTQHGRRPVILNRPFRSVGELGFVFRDEPFKTLDFFTQYSADAALLDVFSINDEATVTNSQLSAVVAGRLNPTNASQTTLKAIFSGAAKKEDFDPTYNMSLGGDAKKSAQNASNLIVSTGNGGSGLGPLLNRANLVTELMAGVSGNGMVTGYTALVDKRNKTYFEASVRALADITNTRTWNLLIDIIAQSGHMSPTAVKLDDFIVEGERRYWLHIAIDRYTGKIVDQQLEPVYE